MKNQTISKQINIFMTIGIGLLILSSLPSIGNLHISTHSNPLMSSSSSPSLPPLKSVQGPEVKCPLIANQTVVQWKDMFWYPCKLSWHGFCIWPPFRRRHITYKVTVHEGIPFRDQDGNSIAIAKEKIRDWEVYDATEWNQIPDSPLHLARYPDYEPIASNEYVVMVETRYRLFNNVEETLRICVQQP